MFALTKFYMLTITVVNQFFAKSQQILFYCLAAILNAAMMLPTVYQTNFKVRYWLWFQRQILTSTPHWKTNCVQCWIQVGFANMVHVVQRHQLKLNLASTLISGFVPAGTWHKESPVTGNGNPPLVWHKWPSNFWYSIYFVYLTTDTCCKSLIKYLTVDK